MDKIKKILNNNAILVAEGENLDCIWVGAGVGFQKRIGDYPDAHKRERRFVIDNPQQSEDIKRLLESISTDYLKLAIDIVDYAKTQLIDDISNSIYIALADHLANSISLNEKGLSSGTELSWEIKKLYPREYQIGKKAIEMIEEQTGRVFDEFEIGNIALHLINAQVQKTSGTKEATKKIKDILTLIRIHNKIELASESLAYDRFVTHLRFFFKRMDTRVNHAQLNPLIDEVKARYPKAFETMTLIEEYLKMTLTQDEQVYLCLHIQKLIENS